jgi:hypothetical protein
MLLTFYQQSEVFAASRLTSFGDGPDSYRSWSLKFIIGMLDLADAPFNLEKR